MKKFIVWILAACLLSGCQLATLSTGDGLPVNDQLVGMYITMSGDDTSNIPAWDEEAMGMEPLHTFQSQGKKLYAQRVETPDVTDDGVSDPRQNWQFPGDYGLTFITFYEPDDSLYGGFWNYVNDPELSGGRKHVKSSDDGTSIELEAIVYVADTVKLHELTLYLNPVYQTPEGEIYALGTAPMGYDAASMYGNSETISQETSTTLPDGIKTTGGSVTLRMEKVVLPEVYVILEMDEHNQVIRTNEYTPEEMPETYTPGADAAYVILESRGTEKTVRTVYSPDDEVAVMDTFSPGRFGICIKGYTRISWEGEV